MKYSKTEIDKATETLRRIYFLETGNDNPEVKIDSFLTDLYKVLNGTMRIENYTVVYS